jgi:hypothetical protein
MHLNILKDTVEQGYFSLRFLWGQLRKNLNLFSASLQPIFVLAHPIQKIMYNRLGSVIVFADRLFKGIV